MRAALLCGEQHAQVITGDTPMLTSKAKFSANAATTFGLATTVAALWMAAVPFAGAAADVQISAARAAAIQQQKRGLGAGVLAVFGLRANATHSAPRCLPKARLSRCAIIKMEVRS